MHLSNKPERRRARRLWPPLACAAWLASMGWVAPQTGLGGMAAGLVLAALLAVPVAGAFLWLDRWEHARPRLLASAFVWGASFAALSAIWSQTALQALADTAVGTDFGKWFRPLVITPVTEEGFKYLFLVWLSVHRRRQIAGLLHGIVYGGLVGAGFAFTENTLYLGKAVTAFAAAGTSDAHAVGRLLITLLLRMVMIPYFHPLMVALSGIAVAASMARRGRVARTATALAGPLAAAALHGAWDWASLAGGNPFLIYEIYGAVLVPVFLTMLVLALVLRRRQGRALAASLPALARTGHIAADEVPVLGDLASRRRARGEARRRAGRGASRATARYQAAVSSLGIGTARAHTVQDRDVLAEQAREAAAARAEMAAALAARRA
ncbi:PrsW family intramembrane metalloprotease [Streptomyces tremellae]|uniref:PrsW family intramembrane metalloprotease n=1 Tax=Streptomyces tremellae TaxID=1124239 RepID=A0ABP7DNN7_9ACTN